MLKNKSFLEKTSANNIAKIMAQILTIYSDKEETSNGRSITLLRLITDILIFKRDKEKIKLTENEFEIILELEYLNNLANNHEIKDKNLHRRLREYLISIQKNYNDEDKKFEVSETSKEQHNYFSIEIKKLLPVIKLLNSIDF